MYLIAEDFKVKEELKEEEQSEGEPLTVKRWANAAYPHTVNITCFITVLRKKSLQITTNPKFFS